jgi:hypothetical protein
MEDSFQLADAVISELNRCWQPFTIDRFATKQNAVHTVYNSYFNED